MTGQHDKVAEEISAWAIRLNPDDAAAFTNRAMARKLTGDTSGADADNDRAKALGAKAK